MSEFKPCGEYCSNPLSRNTLQRACISCIFTMYGENGITLVQYGPFSTTLMAAPLVRGTMAESALTSSKEVAAQHTPTRSADILNTPPIRSVEFLNTPLEILYVY